MQKFSIKLALSKYSNHEIDSRFEHLLVKITKPRVHTVKVKQIKQIF
jgi:hypothetical protein